jgi:hypothetical protein
MNPNTQQIKCRRKKLKKYQLHKRSKIKKKLQLRELGSNFKT